MHNLSQLIQNIDQFIEFIDSYRNLINTHNVQFLVEDHWFNSSIINTEIQTDLDLLVQDCHLSSQIPNLLRIYIKKNESLIFPNIEKLFCQLKYLNKIWNEEILTPANSIFDSNNIVLNNFEATFLKNMSHIERQNRFMNEKKTYEVDLMSKFVAKLCKNKNINTVYISIFLSLYF